MKKIYDLVIDTETCPLDNTVEGVCPENMFAYDFGWSIIDRKGNVYLERSFINADIFFGEKDLMKSAYYAKKIPMYIKDIENGTRTLATYATIRRTFINDMADFGITRVWAHNMRFDLGALNNTTRWITKSKYRYFFPYGTEIMDTMKIARQLIATMPTYKKFCEDNGYMTKNNQVQLKAEVIYKFISNDNGFEESHTGLEDVRIEREILAYCYRKHKKMNGRLFA